MAKITAGPLRGFWVPDYDGGSILNLLASIIKAQGGRSPHPELSDLPRLNLRGFRHIIYLVIDGLGAEQLRDFLAAASRPAFFSRPRRVLTAVWPATTAPAVTTFATGATPAEHGIIGWHMNLPDLGLVATILPAVTRTGVEVAPPEFDLGAYLRIPSHLQTTRYRRVLIAWRAIPRSRSSRAVGGWHRRLAFGSLRELEVHLLRFAYSRGRGLAYAYWPGYDELCHEVGSKHPRARRHLLTLDRLLSRLARRLRHTDTALIVTADHGVVDTPAKHRVDLRSVPGLYGCLATLPSGDARLVHFFVRPAQQVRFLSIVRRHLGRAGVCVAGSDVLGAHLLGPGRQHPGLAGRLGDFVLVAREDYAFASSLPGMALKFNVANHGGMSAREVLVPMWLVGRKREGARG